MTIEQLYKECAKQIKNGNGNKTILISTDDEGNGFHVLFYTFSDAEEIFDGSFPPRLPYDVEKEELKNYVTLG